MLSPLGLGTAEKGKWTDVVSGNIELFNNLPAIFYLNKGVA